MVQVKKETIRNAIVDSARDLFSERGYHRTTLQDIAQLAGTGVSSLYSYFPSKLHLLYAVVEPWEKESIQRLEERIRKIRNPHEKLRAILLGVWRDIPMENLGLANSHIEALATADPGEKKPSSLLSWTEAQLRQMLENAVPESDRRVVDYDLLSHLFLMAYDGFVINRRLDDVRDIERLVDAVCTMMIEPAAPLRLSSARSSQAKPKSSRSRRKQPI